MAQLWPHIWVFGTFWAYLGSKFVNFWSFVIINFQSFLFNIKKYHILSTNLNGTQCKIPDFRSFFEYQRMQKWPKMIYLLKIVSFGCNYTDAFKSHPETWEAYFIKWTTSGEPPVGLKSPKDSNMGSQLSHTLYHSLIVTL